MEFSDGQLSRGTKVFLSDGSELAGVIAVEQCAALGEIQEITVRVIKGKGPEQ